jgi:hypothetical protein
MIGRQFGHFRPKRTTALTEAINELHEIRTCYLDMNRSLLSKLHLADPEEEALARQIVLFNESMQERLVSIISKIESV